MRTRPSYTHTVLTVIAVLLGLHLMVRFDGSTGNAAFAQPENQPGSTADKIPFNAAEQRKTMIAQLEQIHRRLGAIESRLDRGISVKVTEMPAMPAAEKK
ncbi:MAG: hypothetical protein H7Y88_04655 [Phycisphaerales bacterium]|nr:hypothetical protein [Phycisphaerales bacterium]